MNFAIAVAGASQQAPAPAAAAVEHRKLTDAAQQFEGMLLEEMLKPMKQHGFCRGDGDDGGDSDADNKDGGSGLGDTLSSYGTEALATAIAKGGGMGIAKRVVEQVEREKSAKGKGT